MIAKTQLLWRRLVLWSRTVTHSRHSFSFSVARFLHSLLKFSTKTAYLARFACYSAYSDAWRCTMRAPENRLERIGQIESKLVQRPEGWTTGELAREFQVDASTIFRDLGLLESMGTGLIK